MNNDLYQTMIESLGKDVSVFQKFVLENRKYKDTLFYFVEGEDFCYYNPRIKQYSKSTNHIDYSCDGKKNVIGVKKLIEKKCKIKQNNKVKFMVDKDYNLEKIPKGIYITDYYSIENFYLNEETIKQVLENIMEVNKNSNNFTLCLKYFKKTYEEYSQFAIKLNAFFYTIRVYEKKRKKPRADFNLKKFSYFVKNTSLDKFEMKEITYEQLIKDYKIEYNIDIEECNQNISLFKSKDHSNFRGKFELEFFKYFLNTVRNAIINGEYGFDKSIVCKYDFYTDTMKMLSQYAYTPKSLIDYLEN
ncbi:MAG: DUF4435 domain-containing protein [Clostridia bacterium]|nr:DUF4435 domain-containing protein [Clostridia bacterium]